MTTALDRSAPGDDYQERLAATLRGYLAERRIKNRTLGELLGRDDFWVGRRLNGKSAISVGDLMHIAHVLNEDVARLLPEWRNDEAPHPDGPDGGLAVRHQGLEPRTRCVSGGAHVVTVSRLVAA